MTATPRISRARVIVLCLGVVFLALTVVARQRGWWFAPLTLASLDELRREHARLAAHDDETVTRLRRELVAIRATASLDPDALIAIAGDRFTSSFDPTSNRLTFRLAVVAPRWNEIVTAVGRLEHQPAWRLVGLDLRSRGSRHRREISTVEIVLERAAATPGRPAVGPLSPGDSPPARPRNAGRSTALRRASAFAPFRARPSGLGRHTSHPSPIHSFNHHHQ